METTQPAIRSILVKVCLLNKRGSCLDFVLNYTVATSLASIYFLVTGM